MISKRLLIAFVLWAYTYHYHPLAQLLISGVGSATRGRDFVELYTTRDIVNLADFSVISHIKFTLPNQTISSHSFIILKSNDFSTVGIYTCNYKYEHGIEKQSVNLYHGNHPIAIIDKSSTVIDVYGPQPIKIDGCAYGTNCYYYRGWALRKSYTNIWTDISFKSYDWIIQRNAFYRGVPFACQSFQLYGKSEKSTVTNYDSINEIVYIVYTWKHTIFSF